LSRYLLKINAKLAHLTGWNIKRYVADLDAARQHVFGLTDPQIVVDGGANRGQWAESLRVWNSSIPILSFEPVSDPFNFLKGLSLNSHRCEKLALSDSEGEVEILVASNIGMSSTLGEPTEALLRHYPTLKFTQKEKVRSLRLDDFPGLLGQRTYLKLDLEGHEWNALLGANLLLENDVAAIEIETSLKQNHQGEKTHYEIISYLIGKGFRPFHLSPAGTSHNGEMNYVDVILVKHDYLD
jgi:FkbM family methyltransferase